MWINTRIKVLRAVGLTGEGKSMQTLRGTLSLLQKPKGSTAHFLRGRVALQGRGLHVLHSPGPSLLLALGKSSGLRSRQRGRLPTGKQIKSRLFPVSE